MPYPHKAGFNKPSFAALSRLNEKPVRIPEPAGQEAKRTRMYRGWSGLVSWLTTANRFQREIVARSPEENRRKLKTLKESRKAEKEGGNESRVKVLSLEIRLIEEALKKNNKKNAQNESR
jgi:hypothetical protein